MIKQTKKYRVAFITLVSAVLFCYLLVVSSLSPLANSGHNANQFNSLGMWSAIGTVLLFYIMPLIVYMLGVESMKFVMSVILSLGILIDFSLIAVIFMLNLTTKNKFSSLIGVIGLCIVSLIVNVIWFFVAFRLSSKIKN